MATERKTEHVRFRYGICLNDNCPRCKSKEVQEIASRKDFVCEECGKPLRECPPPRKKSNGTLIGIIAGVVVVLAAVIFFLVSGDSNENALPGEENVVVEDIPETPEEAPVAQAADTIRDTVYVENNITTIIETPAQEETKPEKNTQVSGSGTIRLSYGTYTGEIKNGYPEGQGRLVYSTTRVINKYDQKERQAKAGEYVMGEFQHGYFIQGKHYGSDGAVIQTLMIGVPASLGYESK